MTGQWTESNSSWAVFLGHFFAGHRSRFGSLVGSEPRKTISYDISSWRRLTIWIQRPRNLTSWVARPRSHRPNYGMKTDKANPHNLDSFSSTEFPPYMMGQQTCEFEVI